MARIREPRLLQQYVRSTSTSLCPNHRFLGTSISVLVVYGSWVSLYCMYLHQQASVRTAHSVLQQHLLCSWRSDDYLTTMGRCSFTSEEWEITIIPMIVAVGRMLFMTWWLSDLCLAMPGLCGCAYGRHNRTVRFYDTHSCSSHFLRHSLQGIDDGLHFCTLQNTKWRDNIMSRRLFCYHRSRIRVSSNKASLTHEPRYLILVVSQTWAISALVWS